MYGTGCCLRLRSKLHVFWLSYRRDERLPTGEASPSPLPYWNPFTAGAITTKIEQTTLRIAYVLLQQRWKLRARNVRNGVLFAALHVTQCPTLVCPAAAAFILQHVIKCCLQPRWVAVPLHEAKACTLFPTSAVVCTPPHDVTVGDSLDPVCALVALRQGGVLVGEQCDGPQWPMVRLHEISEVVFALLSYNRKLYP